MEITVMSHRKKPHSNLKHSRPQKPKARCQVVAAGPGTGKTTMLLELVQSLLMSDTRLPILLLTFSKQAVQDIQQRLTPTPLVQVSTLHAFGYQLIREFHQRLGYRQPPAFMDTAQAQAALKTQFERCFAKERIDKQQKQVLEKLLWRAVQHEADIEKHIAQQHPELSPWADKLIELKQHFQKSQRKKGSVTYGDQVTVARKLLREHPDVLQIVGRRYQAVLVDEFQDLCPAQLDIVRALATVIGQVVVVGDEAQSIYGFRGACGDALQRFGSWFPEAEHSTLPKSHRCSQPIITLANSLRKTINGVSPVTLTSTKSGPKPCHVKCQSMAHQDRIVVRLIQEMADKKNVRYAHMAILARTQQSLFELYRALAQAGIPALIGTPESHDHICRATQHLLRLIDGENGAIHNVLEALSIEPTPEHGRALQTLGRKPPIGIEYLVKRIKQARASHELEFRLVLIQECLRHYLDPSHWKWLQPHFDQLKARTRSCQTLNEVLDVIEEYNDHAIERVVLQTIHGSKGLEYDAVFVVDMVDGYFPHHKALSERGLNNERKLLYVAATRARKYLALFSVPYIEYNHNAHRVESIKTKCSLLTKHMQPLLTCLER
jgi:DNA helicase-2/ATP-dependent DNA helicase PcrA